MKLDSLVVRGLIKSLDLVKIDVEDAELMVSRGATSTITNFKPILSIDVNHYLGEYEEIKFLNNSDYTCSPLYGHVDELCSIICYHQTKANLAKKLIDFTCNLLRCQPYS